jgi:EmrB/QacA subfamily drug resistance transporter
VTEHDEGRERGPQATGYSPRDVTLDAPGIDEQNVATWPLLFRLKHRLVSRGQVSNRWAVLAVVLVGLFTVSVTITLLAVSLSDIAKDLGTTTSVVNWTIVGPMLAFGIVGPAAGKAGDLFGHKKLFLIGLFGAGVFAFLTALSWNAASLIAFRTLSASFGSAAGPAAIAIINRIFDNEERVKALGYWSFVSAGAPVIGVVLGGPLVEAVGWRAIFVVQAPLCMLGLLVAFLLLPETERLGGVRFDWKGALLLGLSTTTLLLGVNRGRAWGWSSPALLSMFLVSALALAAFVAVERRAVEPLLPLSWLRRRNVVAPIGTQALSNFAYMGGFLITPVLLEDGLGYTTAFVGLLIISRPLAFSIAAPTGSRLTIRVGERTAGVAGGAIVVASMLCLAAIGEGTSSWFIVLALALSGIGLGLQSPAMGATVAEAVDEKDLGVAGALQQLMTQVGAVIGAQVMQTVQESTVESHGLIGSYGVAYQVGAVVAACGVGAAWFVRSSSRNEAFLHANEAPEGASLPA